MKLCTVLIPCRENSQPRVTLETLGAQTWREFDIVIAYDEHRGQSYALNKAAKLAQTPYLLFSDDDICWRPHALQLLFDTLQTHTECAYSYGAYSLDGWIQCNQPFDAARLRQVNYISTMSMIRREDFPGFDENLRRLIDWDLWLTLLEKNKIGIYCDDVIFTTAKRQGVTYGGAVSLADAKRAIAQKHKLPGV